MAIVVVVSCICCFEYEFVNFGSCHILFVLKVYAFACEVCVGLFGVCAEWWARLMCWLLPWLACVWFVQRCMCDVRGVRMYGYCCCAFGILEWPTPVATAVLHVIAQCGNDDCHTGLLLEDGAPWFFCSRIRLVHAWSHTFAHAEPICHLFNNLTLHIRCCFIQRLSQNTGNQHLNKLDI